MKQGFSSEQIAECLHGLIYGVLHALGFDLPTWEHLNLNAKIRWLRLASTAEGVLQQCEGFTLTDAGKILFLSAFPVEDRKQKEDMFDKFSPACSIIWEYVARAAHALFECEDCNTDDLLAIMIDRAVKKLQSHSDVDAVNLCQMHSV